MLSATLLLALPAQANFTMTVYDPCTGDIDCNVTNAPSGTSDQYHGGGDVGESAFIGDVVGGVADFDVLQMGVTVDGMNIQVDIQTRFRVDALSYPNISFGDLLISTTGWFPAGAAPHDSDTATTSGTNWNYGFQTCVTSGTDSCDIQAIDGLTGTNLVKSDDVMQDGLFRGDQYIKTADNNATGQKATVTVDDAYLLPDAVDGTSLTQGSLISYTFSLADLGLSNSVPADIALRWSMTCANDIIEASFHLPASHNLPVPDTLPLLFVGLAGMAGFSRRTSKQAVKSK